MLGPNGSIPDGHDNVRAPCTGDLSHLELETFVKQ